MSEPKYSKEYQEYVDAQYDKIFEELFLKALPKQSEEEEDEEKIIEDDDK